ncbi:MAG: hypothetical protein ACXWUP_09870 [Allosphingosinicella sp.]
MGRTLLILAAALLLVTAVLHAVGVPMMSAWTAALPEAQRAVLRLVWVTDAVDRTVVALIWIATAWRGRRAWRRAAALASLIPLAAGIGIVTLDAYFFGGWLLIFSVLLAMLGLRLMGGLRGE